MAVYGTFLYGHALYGLSGFPTSDPWDVFDFCYPTDATMLSLLSWSEVTPARAGGIYSWFNAANDYCMMSNDGLDSGFRFDYSVPHSTFSIQFAFMPTALPEDFSDLVNERFFVGAFNQFGRCAGLLMSENGGFALSADGVTISSVFPDSADIFAEGLDYYVVRVTVDEVTGRANLYASRKAVYAATGVLELRYTFSPLYTPAGEVDNFRVEVVGSAGDPTEICLDCFRMSSELVLGNQRPVAVIGDDQARVLTQFGSFDGRDSYDPDTPPQPLIHAWTITDAPDGSGSRLTGEGVTPADASGYTNVITGPVGTFSGVLEGDLVKGDLPLDSVVMRVASDGSWVALNRDAMVAGSAVASWEVITQSGWGGTRLVGTTMTDVLERRADPSALTPTVGDKYLIIPTALFAWATHEGEIATWNGASWDFELLAAGRMVFVIDELDGYRTAGSGIWELSDPKVWELDVWEGRLAPVGSYLADALGLYTIQLVVSDGVRDSLPAEALLNIYQTNVPLGLTPDLSFIWNYLGDVWGLVDDKDKVESFWSSAAQGATDELMNLWQRAYSKSLLDIQRVFQRRWLNYDPWYEEPDYEELPATINNDVSAAGFADNPTPTPVPGDLEVDPEHTYALNSGDMPAEALPGHYLILDGIAYRILRIEGDRFITSHTLPVTDRPSYWMVRPTVLSRSSNFSLLAVQVNDTAVFEVRTEDGDVLEVPAHIWGARGSVLAFDDATSLLSGYLASDTYTVRFKGVLRRSAIAVDDLVQNVPRLQEAIKLLDADGPIDGVPDPLLEGNDFRVEVVSTVEDS